MNIKKLSILGYLVAKCDMALFRGGLSRKIRVYLKKKIKSFFFPNDRRKRILEG